MSIIYKKNRTLKRIMRNKFRAAPLSATRIGSAAPVPTAAPAYTLSTDIPESYNDTYVRAIPQNPQSTFVYWEMPKDKAADSGVTANGSIHTDNNEAAAMEWKVRDDNKGGNREQHYSFEDHSWHWGSGNTNNTVGANCVCPPSGANTGGWHDGNHNVNNDNSTTHDCHREFGNNAVSGDHHHTDTAACNGNDGNSRPQTSGIPQNVVPTTDIGSAYIRTPRAAGQRETFDMPSSSILPHLSSGILQDGDRGKNS